MGAHDTWTNSRFSRCDMAINYHVCIAEPDQPKKVQFSESVSVKTVKQDEVEINEEKIDR